MNFITLSSAQTVYIRLGGYFYDRLENVILSCTNSTLLPYLCSYDFLTTNILLSSVFPTVSGYPVDTYTIQGENKLVVTLSGISFSPATYDLIFANQAGYSKLSDRDYLIVRE